MSSEREKLIEIWLDNAGERQYQFAFRNALLVAGQTILHDTSHTSLELGKDILAIDERGGLIAYQLKGNPGQRITISQWHELLPQINALVYQPVMHPSVKPGTPHTPILVTNGEIHEDVQAAIATYNAALGPSLTNARPLQTIARGQVLELVLNSAHLLWPVGVSAQRNILNVFVAPGDDEFPTGEFVDILSQVLTGKHTEVAIPSVHLIASIISSNWIERRNYFELVKMYAILIVASCCYQSRWKRRKAKDRRFIEEMIFDMRSHLRNFVRELALNYRHEPLLNSDIFAEFGYFHPRKKMISGLASLALLDQQLELDHETRDFLWTFVCKSKHSEFLLWEGIVPYCLTEFWALSNIQGTREPHRRLFSLLNDILVCNDKESEENHLPGPYYSLSEVVEWKYKYFLQRLRSDLDRDSHHRRSWFAETLFLLLARRNYKSTCQLLWPTLTKFIHVSTRLPDAASFGPAKCNAALSEDKLIDVTTPRTWEDVIAEASISPVPQIPDQLLIHPIVVLAYCLFVPQRLSRDIILWLDRVFCKTWY